MEISSSLIYIKVSVKFSSYYSNFSTYGKIKFIIKKKKKEINFKIHKEEKINTYNKNDKFFKFPYKTFINEKYQLMENSLISKQKNFSTVTKKLLILLMNLVILCHYLDKNTL